jgi:hypothetical protein
MSLTNTPHPHVKTTNKNFAWVVATASEMIEETLYHCDTFAHALRAHHNIAAAEVFETFSPALSEELDIVLQALKNVELPRIPPWEIPHLDYDHPASNLMERTHYLMTPVEAHQLINDMIRTHTCLYNHLLEATHQPEIAELVKQLLNLCLQCRQRNQQAMNQADAVPPLTDDDPPNEPA